MKSVDFGHMGTIYASDVLDFHLICDAFGLDVLVGDAVVTLVSAENTGSFVRVLS